MCHYMKNKIIKIQTFYFHLPNCQYLSNYLVSLVINHMLFQDGENEPSEVHIGRMLQILREFSDDPVLSSYVIDDIWEDMKAMRV